MQHKGHHKAQCSNRWGKTPLCFSQTEDAIQTGEIVLSLNWIPIFTKGLHHPVNCSVFCGPCFRCAEKKKALVPYNRTLHSNDTPNTQLFSLAFLPWQTLCYFQLLLEDKITAVYPHFTVKGFSFSWDQQDTVDQYYWLLQHPTTMRELAALPCKQYIKARQLYLCLGLISLGMIHVPLSAGSTLDSLTSPPQHAACPFAYQAKEAQAGQGKKYCCTQGASTNNWWLL